jgi:hypothetical protein
MKKSVNSVQPKVSETLACSGPEANPPSVRRKQGDIPPLNLLALLETENSELRNSAVQLALDIQELRMRRAGSIEKRIPDRDSRGGSSYH